MELKMEDKFQYHFASDPDAPRIESVGYQCYTADKGINSSRTVSFHVEGFPDSFIDTSKCYLSTTFKIVNADGTNLEINNEPDGQPSPVFPTEHYGNNLWSQASVSLNSTQLPPNNDYAYTARFIDIIGASQENTRNYKNYLSGSSSLAYGGSKVSMADLNTYLIPKMACAGSSPITVYNRITSDLMMSCGQLLPNGMSLGITLTKSKDNFVLCRDADEDRSFKLEIVSVSFFVKRVQLNINGMQRIEKMLESGGKLLFQRLHTIAFPCPQGSRSWNWHNCFNGVVPRRVFLAIVSQEAYHGSWSRTSVYLESAHVSSVRFQQNGREIMPQPYNCSFVYHEGGRVNKEASDAKSAFAGLCRVTGSFDTPRLAVGIPSLYFLDSSTIFAVNLDHVEGMGPASGSFDAFVDFAIPCREPYMIILMGEYPKSVVFDGNRHITQL